MNDDVRQATRINATALCVVFFTMAAILLRVAPVIVYDCGAGDGGAHCRIERRWAGLFRIDSAQVERIDHAYGSSWGGRKNRKSQIKLESADSQTLYEDTQQNPIGIGHHELEDRINALAQGKASAPLHAWRVPWVPLLVVSLMMVAAIPIALETMRKRIRPSGQPRPRLFIGLAAALIVACWVAAALGEVPAFLAAAPN